MRRYLPISFLLCIACQAQQYAPLAIAFEAPDSTQTNAYTAFLRYELPFLSGIAGSSAHALGTGQIYWADLDACGSPPGTSQCSSEHAYSWGSVDNSLYQYIHYATVGSSGTFNNGCANGNACKIILIINAEQDSGQGVTTVPVYVFSHSYASSNGWADQDVVGCEGWPGVVTPPGGPWPGALPYTGSFMNTNQGVVWSADGCHVPPLSIGGPSCINSTGPFTNMSGFPVVYEKPILTAYQKFISAIQLHYSPAGSGYGPMIAPYIAYIRIGMAAGGENNPGCVGADNSTVSSGVLSNTFWPGPKGFAAEAGCYTQCGYLTNWPGTPQNGLSCTNTSACSTSLLNDGDGYVTAMDKFLGKLFSGTIPATTSSHGGPPAITLQPYADSEALTASITGVGFGMQSARISDQNAFALGNPTTQNWVVNFGRYAAPVHHLQAQANGGENPEASNFGISTISVSLGPPITATANCTGSIGTVNTMGVNVAWASGPQFNLGWTGAFTIAGTVYTISSVNSAFSITLTSTAGTQSGAPYDASNSCDIYQGQDFTIFISGNSNSAFNGQQFVTCKTCPAGTIQFSPSSTSVGSGGNVWASDYWPSLFPFLTQHKTSSIELRACELDYAFGCTPGSACNANTSVLPCGGNPGPDPSYQSALADFVNGIPTATSVTAGKVQIIGNGVKQ